MQRRTNRRAKMPALWRGAVILALLAAALTASALTEAQSGQFAVVLATGGLGDQSFNDQAYEGLRRAEAELGIAFNYVEPQSIAEYEAFLGRFAQTGRFDLIFAIGFDQVDALARVADRFPRQKFALVDAELDRPNVASYVFKEAERGFIMGAVAALTAGAQGDPRPSGANAIGAIGGMDIPLINAAIAGYIAGARFVNPSLDVRYAYVGDWADPARAKELALAQLDQGVGILWAAAGRSGLGVVQAADERGRYVIWTDSDRSDLAPQAVLTSALKLVDNTIYQAIEGILAGKFDGGANALGLAEGGLGYTPGLLPPDIIAEVDAIAQRIARGEIVPPTQISDVEGWLAAHPRESGD